MSLFAQALTRIILRYVAGLLVGAGAFSAATGAEIANDPDLQMLLNVGLIAVGTYLSWMAERFYAYARRKGWTT